MTGFDRKSFLTNDGVRLSYLEGSGGSGKKTLVLLHGWSQSAMTFKLVLEKLGGRYHVYALDFRGHGESEKPAFGYRIARLAKDVDDFIKALDLKDIYILAHSMSGTVLWCYFELFGQNNFAKLILNDQRSAIVRDPGWNAREVEEKGCGMSPETAYQIGNMLRGPQSGAKSREMIRDMFTGGVSRDVLEWITEENFKMPREYAAKMFYSNVFNDWSDVVPRITVPTLIIGGKASTIPWKCLLWENKAVAGSRLEIFEESEGGSHFTFVENPEKYVKIVCDFLG